jgi:hypothetical protein
MGQTSTSASARWARLFLVIETFDSLSPFKAGLTIFFAAPLS